MGLLKRNNLFHPLFTIMNNIKGYLNILYGLELLIPSSGTGTRNCDIQRKLATHTKKKQNKKKKTAKFTSAEDVPEVFLSK